ncbi:ABC transporter permease [Komagataeibacter xylinus]|uniref:ABC transporter permease n=1 Tax=Komagataeibacter xylinus TaxID=28448 RepID=A0A857FLT9_KOMXY|nr:ABC transporter permease [Komagataeibacter xylinus]QHC35166.1 ABC transporter permease [Komagataeibacter xylinus]
MAQKSLASLSEQQMLLSRRLSLPIIKRLFSPFPRFVASGALPVRAVIRRLMSSLMTVLFLSALTFLLVRLAPGSIVDSILGMTERTAEQAAAVRAAYHLDDPLFVQYLRWLGGIARGDFGQSFMLNEPVIDVIRRDFPVSIFLSAYSFVFSMIVGFLLGVIAALRHGWCGRAVLVAITFASSIPTFANGLMLLWLFGIMVPLFPVIGLGNPTFLSRVYHLTLPAIALSIPGAAILARTLAHVLHVIYHEEFVLFARSRGIDPVRIFMAYGLRNALVPVISVLGLVISTTLVGSVLVEMTFSLHGLGMALVDAIENKDGALVQGITMIVAITIVTMNALLDIVCYFADPRMREKKS